MSSKEKQFEKEQALRRRDTFLCVVLNLLRLPNF